MRPFLTFTNSFFFFFKKNDNDNDNDNTQHHDNTP